MLLLLSSFNPSVFLLHGSLHQSPSSSTVRLLGRMVEPPQRGRSVHSCGKPLPWCCCHPRAAGCPKQSQTKPDRSTASLVRNEDLVIICWRRCYLFSIPCRLSPSLLHCYILSNILPHLGITVSALIYRLLTHACVLRILWKSLFSSKLQPTPQIQKWILSYS